jgi:Tfp pilus assembly protein PilX
MLRSATRRLTRIREEDGIALVMALLVMMVLTISLAGVIILTSSSSRDASRVSAGANAYALAEDGLNNAISVLEANYPVANGTAGNSALLPLRSTVVGTGSCASPVNNCVTWSGQLQGPLTSSPWRFQWALTSTGTVQNPTGPNAAPVSRVAQAIVPIVIPDTEPGGGASSPLNFIFAGHDMTFDNQLDVASPVYATNDLHLQNKAVIDGTANKVVVGHDLYLDSPQSQIGKTSGSDPVLPEIHVVHQCASSASNPQKTLHDCGVAFTWAADDIFATIHDNVIPPNTIAPIPQLTCCAPYAGTIAPACPPAPAPCTGATNMGFWYQWSQLGPLSGCTFSSTTGTATLPVFDTASGTADNTINNSATPTTPFNLTPFGGDYTCQSKTPDGTILGELSWNHTTKVLTIKNNVFIDGSATVDATGYSGNPVFTYKGEGSIILSGTFGMSNSKICAVVSGSDCNRAAGAWNPDPNSGGSALIVVADGDGANGGAQSQSNLVAAGEGITIKSSSFQGALIANKKIHVWTTSSEQGPMISVYNDVEAGQTGTLIFPTIYFPPSGGGGIVSPPPPVTLLSPRNFSGG